MILITAIHRRPDLTKRVLRYYEGLPFQTRIAVVSPGENYSPATFPGWTFVHAPNEPLGKKWNTALRAARLFDPDAVMITGSDDLISPAYLDLATSALERFPYVHPESIYMISGGRTVYCDPFPTGAGRAVTRDVLEQARWKLWPDEQRQRMDGAMDQVLREWGSQFCPKVRDYPIVDIKGEGNMWSLEGNEIVRNGDGQSPEKRMKIREVTDVDRDWLMGHFPGFDRYAKRAA